ncbi:unnamed protein product [Chironomus riparius]|uniref:Ionotropic receptor n=1 Tax=Chironomus riparius TaxID=315576 RepID=A0A9N9WYK4_9DIPT|nr:unnamed protein product [Chironomus riparius]
MKISSHFIILLLILIFGPSIASSLRLKSLQNSEKLSNSICRITNDMTNSKTYTQDILIANLGGKGTSPLADEIIRCLNGGNAVVTSNLRSVNTEMNLRKAPIIILMFNKVDKMDYMISKMIINQHHSSVWNHMAKIIAVVPDSSSINNRINILQVFTYYGFLNVATVHKTSSNDVQYSIVKSLAGDVEFLTNPQDSNSVFPDKLQNMHGYNYRVVLFQQKPIVNLYDSTRVPKMMHFLHAIKKIQNSGTTFKILSNSSYFDGFWENREMDLTLNTAVVIDIQEPKLLTYEKKGYCIMAPIPQKVKFSDIILHKPFDGLTWILFALSIACSVAVWRLFYGRGAVDSHWQLAVGIFMMFIGQGADFSRKNRFVLAVLLNIICLSVFLLSSLYESIITSYMIEPAYEYRMKSLDDLLASNICRITNDMTNSKTYTQDILIANLGGKVTSPLADEIIRCLNGGNAVVITNLGTKILELNLRKASIIIIGFPLNSINKWKISKLIVDQHHSTVWNHMAKIICIVPHDASYTQRMTILIAFSYSGFLNVAIVHKAVNDNIQYEIIKSMAGEVKFLTNPKDSNSIFPDKLQNMHGYRYRVPIFQQNPHIDLFDKTKMPKMMHFLKAVGTIQNSMTSLIFLQNHTLFTNYWESQAMDLTINTAVVIDSSEPKLLTYETQGYCILAPIPQKASFSDLILYKPFDELSWILFALSIACSVAIWRFFHGRGAVDSHWQLAVGIFMMFIGQGADFSRKNRFVLAVLLNIICLAVFLLSTLYEGVITSHMIEPAHEYRMKSLNDVLASDYEILMDELFYSKIKDVDSFKEIKTRIKVGKELSSDQYREEIIRQHSVIIRTCVNAEYDINIVMENGHPVSSYYYIIPEKFADRYVQLEASYMNPFLQRLQYFMDLSFQAGLHHIWDVYSTERYAGSHAIEEERQLLKLEDFHQIFIVLAVGLALASLALLIEIFTRDCIRHFSLSDVQNWFKLVCSSCFKKQKGQKVNVRKIMVKP